MRHEAAWTHPQSGQKNVLVLVDDLDNCQGALESDESVYVEKAATKRFREFSAGRTIARRGLHRMHIPETTILVDKDRCPIWPDGVIGSISHSKDTVGVALARTGSFLSLGFDLDSSAAATRDRRDLILTEDERARKKDPGTAELTTLTFSCKESVYKAVFPIAREFLDLRDIEISFSEGGYFAKCLKECRSRQLIENGKGFLEVGAKLVLTLFTIR